MPLHAQIVAFSGCCRYMRKVFRVLYSEALPHHPMLENQHAAERLCSLLAR